MSNAIARILFASASLILTCVLAVASASTETHVPQPTTHSVELRQAAVVS